MGLVGASAGPLVAVRPQHSRWGTEAGPTGGVAGDSAAVWAFMHRLYGMYLALLACRMERHRQHKDQHGMSAVFPHCPRTGGRGGGRPCGQLHGPLPPPLPRQPLVAAPGRRLDTDCKKDLLEWASRL